MMKPLSRFFSLPDCTGRSCSHSNNGNRLSISWKIKFCTLIGFGLLWVQPLAAASKVQPPVDIPVETANRFGRLWIKSSDRIQPVDTYCSELLRKIYHRDHYGSLNANQMVLQWLCNPDFWKQVPLIYVKDRPLRDQFGEGEAHIAYTRFFDEQDTYLLVPEIEATFYRSLHVYNQHEKEVLKTDDKINLLMALWLMGGGAVLGYNLIAHLRFRRYLARWCRPVKEGDTIRLFNGLCDSLSLYSRPRLRVCPGLAVPMLAGLFRPVLLLPEDAAGSDGLGYALLHELVHYRRRDIWLKTLVLWVNAVHWFNPLVWLMVRAVERDTELACDEGALKRLPPEEHAAYGRAILQAVAAVRKEKS